MGHNVKIYRREIGCEAVECVICLRIGSSGVILGRRTKTNSVAWVRERTIHIERPPLVGEVGANFTDRGCHIVSLTDPYSLILRFLDRTWSWERDKNMYYIKGRQFSCATVSFSRRPLVSGLRILQAKIMFCLNLIKHHAVNIWGGGGTRMCYSRY
jgi:hypothetical protein